MHYLIQSCYKYFNPVEIIVRIIIIILNITQVYLLIQTNEIAFMYIKYNYISQGIKYHVSVLDMQCLTFMLLIKDADYLFCIIL